MTGLKVPPLHLLQAVLSIFHSLALLTTALRITHRYRTSRLWWDDFWAFVAEMCSIFVWILFLVFPSSMRVRQPLGIQIFFKYGVILGYTLGLWAARISIAVTIVRLVTKGPFRRICEWAVYLFIFFCLVLLIRKIFFCGTRWKEVPTCGIPRETIYVPELTSDLIGDAWLIGAPAYMLWRMRLSNRHRRLIMAIFSCGIFNTFASIAHAYFVVVRSQAWIGITAHMQLAVSIMVCNLLVIVTFLYRVFQNQDQEDTESSESISTVHNPAANLAAALALEIERRPTTTHPAPIFTLTNFESSSGNTDRQRDRNSTYEGRSCLHTSDFQLSFTDISTNRGSLSSYSGKDGSGNPCSATAESIPMTGFTKSAFS